MSHFVAAAPDRSPFDPLAYLDEYYGDLGPENVALLEFMRDTVMRIPKGGLLLDFGGGPTIYPLASAALCADEIHVADYLEANREEVRRWLAGDPLAFDWDPFIRKAVELEGGAPCSDAAVEQRSDEIRRRVTQVLHCDASRTPPIEAGYGPYDVVLTNFCAESATSDHQEWRTFMRNITSVLKPGGWIAVSALKDATSYAVGPHSFPAVEIGEAELVEILRENGFDCDRITVRTIPADRPTRDYGGLMLTAARKLPDPRGGAR